MVQNVTSNMPKITMFRYCTYIKFYKIIPYEIQVNVYVCSKLLETWMWIGWLTLYVEEYDGEQEEWSTKYSYNHLYAV